MIATITPIPDHIGAILKYWREQTPLRNVGYFPNLVIRGKLTPDIAAFSYFLTVAKSGGSEEENSLPIYRPRVDVRCYGPDGLRAMDLWRYVHATLIPADRRGQSSIDAGTCRILSVSLEAGPIELEEPEDDWPFVFAVYRFTVLQVPI